MIFSTRVQINTRRTGQSNSQAGAVNCAMILWGRTGAAERTQSKGRGWIQSVSFLLPSLPAGADENIFLSPLQLYRTLAPEQPYLLKTRRPGEAQPIVAAAATGVPGSAYSASSPSLPHHHLHHPLRHLQPGCLSSLYNKTHHKKKRRRRRRGGRKKKRRMAKRRREGEPKAMLNQGSPSRDCGACRWRPLHKHAGELQGKQPDVEDSGRTHTKRWAVPSPSAQRL